MDGYPIFVKWSGDYNSDIFMDAGVCAASGIIVCFCIQKQMEAFAAVDAAHCVGGPRDTADAAADYYFLWSRTVAWA